jgi:hypothetical protein
MPFDANPCIAVAGYTGELVIDEMSAVELAFPGHN